MDKLMSNKKPENFSEFLNDNQELLKRLNINMDQNEKKNQIRQMKELLISNKQSTSDSLKITESKQMNTFMNNSLLEMLDPEREHKKLIDEFKKNPKTKYDIMLNHQQCKRDIRESKDYGENCFKQDGNQKLQRISRTSNLSMKMTRTKCNINGMDKILIKNLKIETTHTNKYLFLKIIDLPVKITCYQMLLEDEEGNLVIFALYNYDRIKKIDSYKELDCEFAKDKYILIYEPYHKVLKSTFPGIRVDNPEEILIFDDAESFKKFCLNNKNQTAEELKLKGNEFMAKEEYMKAQNCYEQAIEKDPSNAVLYSNLSEANLRLSFNLNSLENADKACKLLGENHPSWEKAMLRKSKALYNMSRFQECKEMLMKIKLDTAEKKNIVKEMNSLCDSKIKNQVGIYDFDKMLEEESNKFYLDYADFVSNKISRVFTKEKGVFVTANSSLKKGELICCIKSIACQREKSDKSGIIYKIDKDSKQTSIYSLEEENRKILIDKIIGRENEYKEFFCLYDGENKNKNFEEREENIKNFEKIIQNDTNYVVNKINKILKLNSFGSGRGLMESNKLATGLWVFPSFFNHSCISNTIIYGIGDFLILKAGKNIEKNEDITVSYYTFESSYKKRQFKLENWNFKCSCALCVYQLENTVNNPIKKYAFDVIEILQENPSNKKKVLGKDKKFDELEENFKSNKDLMSHSRKFSLTLNEKEKQEIFLNLKQKPKEFYDLLQANKKSFSKIEMSLILYIFVTYLGNHLDEKLIISALIEAFGLIKNNLIWFEIKILSCIINFYNSVKDFENYERYYKILYDDYSFLTNNDMDLFNKIFKLFK